MEKVYDSMSHRKYQSNTLCECNYLCGTFINTKQIQETTIVIMSD